MKGEQESFAVWQLEKLLSLWPAVPVRSLSGVLIDFIGRSKHGIDDICRSHFKVFEELFLNRDRDRARQLLSVLVQDTQELKRLAESCRKPFPIISELSSELTVERAILSTAVPPEFFSDPSACLHHPVDAVIWQISDVHFGKYNFLENDPKQLGALVAKPAAEYRKLAPDLIVVSGDVSSTGADQEFQSFVEFCKYVEEFLVGMGVGRVPILVVPGNHDVRWEGDGLADRMQHFQDIVGGSGLCITPFGAVDEECFEGRVKIWRSAVSATSPQLAIVSYEGWLDVVLLVSGYFSGMIPPKVRAAIGEPASLEKLIDLLRVDEGGVNREYLLEIARAPSMSSDVRLGVIHHNPIQYGSSICANPFAPQLLETLGQKGILTLFHGHVHLWEDRSVRRGMVQKRAYPIACSTLSSITTSGGSGMNVCLVGRGKGTSHVSVLPWQLSSTGAFGGDELSVRYQFRLRGGSECEVVHWPLQKQEQSWPKIRSRSRSR